MKDSLKIYKDVPPQDANLLSRLYQPAFRRLYTLPRRLQKQAKKMLENSAQPTLVAQIVYLIANQENELLQVITFCACTWSIR